MSVKVIVKGGPTIQLGLSEFVAQGGEGSVYAKGGRAYKIYADPGKMIPLGKIAELARIQDANVIKPDHVLLDPKSMQPVGYDMRFVERPYVLCQLFPKAFRDRMGITPEMSLDLVRSMQARLKAIHAAGALAVDANEMNWLVGSDLVTAYAIDADSFQTPSFPPTALMESIRDRHAPTGKFDTGTDWFAFAITSFQVFIGVHPYKGQTTPRMSMDDRMLKNISAFDRAVGLPGSVLPFTVIPEVYRAWLHAVLQGGKRVAPPDGLQATIVLTAQTATVVATAQGFTVTEFYRLKIRIDAFIENSNRLIAIAGTQVYVGFKPVGYRKSGVLAFTPQAQRPLQIWVEHQRLQVRLLDTGRDVTVDLAVLDVMTTDGRVYARNAKGMMELVLDDIGDTVRVSSRPAGNMLEYATSVYPGCAVQNLLGACYVTLFPQSRTFPQIRMPELESYRITDARFDGGVLMVIGQKAGKTDKLIFRFSADWTAYDVRTVADITAAGLNFITLDRGQAGRICVHLTEEEKLEVFSCQKDAVGMRVLEDPALRGGLRLVPLAGGVGFIQGEAVYKMTMK